jgi:hypothetical protein
LTVFPLDVPPKKKLYALPNRLFFGLSLALNKREKIFIGITPKNGQEKSTALAMLLFRCHFFK